MPTFRLPTLIHTRSGNSKWLYELSNTNPVWIHPEDAARLGVETGDLVRVTTRIGYFVNKVWVTEGMRPGVVACTHHLGRWRLFDDVGTDRWASALVTREELAPGRFRFRRIEDIQPVRQSSDPDTQAHLVDRRRRAPEPDLPGAARSGQRHALLAPARDASSARTPDDRYGDVDVDTEQVDGGLPRVAGASARPAPGRAACAGRCTSRARSSRARRRTG